MYRLPDVIELGPVPLTTAILMAAAGAAAFLWWLTRKARLLGLDGDLTGDIASGTIIAGLAGVKVLDVLLSPAVHLQSPGLLLVLPTGLRAWAGALLGAAVCLAWYRLRRSADLPALADLAAVPALASLGLVMLGRPWPHAPAVAAALLVAAGALHRLRDGASFTGHLGLGALVLGSLAFVLTDFFGPGGPRLLGFSLIQAGAALVGTLAYTAARLLAGDEA